MQRRPLRTGDHAQAAGISRKRIKIQRNLYKEIVLGAATIWMPFRIPKIMMSFRTEPTATVSQQLTDRLVNAVIRHKSLSGSDVSPQFHKPTVADGISTAAFRLAKVDRAGLPQAGRRNPG